MENNCNTSIIDNAAGVCSGLAAYKFVQRLMRYEYQINGSIIRTGCVLIAGFAGIKVGTIIRDQTQKLRLELNSSIRINKNEKDETETGSITLYDSKCEKVKEMETNGKDLFT